MSAITRRVATQAFRTPRAPARQIRRSYAETTAEEQQNVLRKGARRDPELYVRASQKSP